MYERVSKELSVFFDQAVKYLEITDVPRKIAPKFSFFFCFIYRWTLGGQEGKEYYQKDRSGVDVQQASWGGGGGSSMKLWMGVLKPSPGFRPKVAIFFT